MRERINAALKTAMKDKEQLRVSTLRLMCAALKEREISLRSDDGEDLSNSEIIQVLAKMVKQREESATSYENAGRKDLAQRERQEIKVVREFLPKPLSQEESEAAIKDAIHEVSAASLKDMGKVMAVLKAKYAGRMNFAEAGARIKKTLD